MFKKAQWIFVVAAFQALPALAAQKTYQVTGPVLEVNANSIVVQKGKEKWEVARDPQTKVNGELKVGAKVTVDYRMVASDIEVKAEKPEKPAKAAKKK